jgi:broad specificity phosphatase PhoE
LGESQAKSANQGWKEQLKDGVPLPQTFYSSPMRRSASTLEITWRDIVLDKGVRPVVSFEENVAN